MDKQQMEKNLFKNIYENLVRNESLDSWASPVQGLVHSLCTQSLARWR